MTASARYEAREYDDAVAARRYVTPHPSSPTQPYAQHLTARAYTPDPLMSRDQPAPNADAALKRCRKFPTTDAVARAVGWPATSRRREMMVGRYYEQEGLHRGINRFKIAVTQYPTTRHEEALDALTEAYRARHQRGAPRRRARPLPTAAGMPTPTGWCVVRWPENQGSDAPSAAGISSTFRVSRHFHSALPGLSRPRTEVIIYLCRDILGAKARPRRH